MVCISWRNQRLYNMEDDYDTNRDDSSGPGEVWKVIDGTTTKSRRDEATRRFC